MTKMAEIRKDESKPEGLPLTLVFALEELKRKVDKILESLERIEETLAERGD